MQVHICLCTCWFGCAVAGVWRSGFFQESVLSFYYVGLKIKLKSSGLVTGTFSHWSILLMLSILTFKFLPTHAAQIPLHYKLGTINCRHFFLRVLEARIPRPKCWQGTITITFFTFIYFVCVWYTHVEFRGQLVWFSFFIPPSGIAFRSPDLVSGTFTHCALPCLCPGLFYFEISFLGL